MFFFFQCERISNLANHIKESSFMEVKAANQVTQPNSHMHLDKLDVLLKTVVQDLSSIFALLGLGQGA